MTLFLFSLYDGSDGMVENGWSACVKHRQDLTRCLEERTAALVHCSDFLESDRVVMIDASNRILLDTHLPV